MPPTSEMNAATPAAEATPCSIKIKEGLLKEAPTHGGPGLRRGPRFHLTWLTNLFNGWDENGTKT
jgi:hypothetical protein